MKNKKMAYAIICMLIVASISGCAETSEDVETVSSSSETETVVAETEIETQMDIETEIEIETESEAEAETEIETEAEITEMVLLYSDEYVDIELISIEHDNVYFRITNISDDIIQINADYIQLDDTTYTYEDTNYSTPIETIASGDTLTYEFCDYDLGNEVDFEITNTDCSVFSGLFEIWAEDGTLIKDAGIQDVSIGSETIDSNNEAEIENETESEIEATETVLLYSDGYVDIELVSIEYDNVYFYITNTSDDIIQVNADYIQLDDSTYTYEDTNYSTPIETIVSGDTLDYKFCDYDLGNEVDFEITNTDCSVFSGMFEIWAEDGTLIENAEIKDISLQ